MTLSGPQADPGRNDIFFMKKAAIIGWLKQDFSPRFQQKESEYLTVLVWFDQKRYWLHVVPRLVEESATWTILPKEGIHMPLKIVAVGPDIPDGKGESPLQIRFSILTDRAQHRAQNGLINWSTVNAKMGTGLALLHWSLIILPMVA